MDWRNNTKEAGSVTITPKPTLVWLYMYIACISTTHRQHHKSAEPANLVSADSAFFVKLTCLYLNFFFSWQDFQLDPASAADVGDGKSLSNDLTLKECLERFTEPESLTQEDAW